MKTTKRSKFVWIKKIKTSFLIIILLISITAIAAEKNKTEIIGNPIENLLTNDEFEPQQTHQADPCFYIKSKRCYSNTLENSSYLIIGNKRNNNNIMGSANLFQDNDKGKDPVEIIADYEADPMIGPAPLAVNFTDLSSAQNTIINSWEWDFNGDGIIDSQLQNPEFLFINPGIYYVTLTVSDGEIDDSKLGIINVVDVDTTFSFIPFSGLEEDNAGGAAWNTDGSGPEPLAVGHFLPSPPASIEIAYYYLASRNYDDIDPQSTAGFFGNGPSSGFSNLEDALELHGKTIQDINISFGLMSLGNDIEGVDWWLIDNIETRIYKGGTYQFKLNNEDLITGDMPDYTQTIVYNLWMGGEDEISGVTGESHPVNNSGGKSPEAQEIAQALMEDIGDDAIRFIFTSTQTANQFEFAGNGRFGGFFENQQGFILKTSTVECALDVDCNEDQFINSGETASLEALASDGTEPYTYLWEPAEFLDDPTIFNPESTPDETTTYICTVTDFEGCEAMDEVTIYVDECDYWFDGSDYTMSFEDVETDRENWTAIDFNPFENEWELFENTADAHTGDYSYKFDYLSTFANDWLFSRCFNLEEDHSYEISFWYKTDSEGDFQLDLRLCTELDSLGEFIHWENDPALTYTEIIDTVTIDSAGVYYFAWQTIFWGDNIVYADDINISDLGIIEEPAESQLISLDLGYQFVSSYLEFDDPDMEFLLDDILPNLDFVRNSGGFMLRKIGPNWINGIGDWITTEGYLFKMLNPDDIELEGTITDLQTPIDLVTGYQIISFLSTEPMDAELAFASIIGANLDFVRNSGGFMLRKIGLVWVNSIGDINPGEGLLVKMLSPDTQIYPEIISKSTSNKVIIETQHFNFEGGNPSEAVYTLYVSGLNIGDEIGVYDGEKLIGANVIVSDNVFENSIPVFSVLTNGQGYTKGNKMKIKVWDSQKQLIVSSDYTFDKEYINAYSQNIFPENDGEFSILNISKNGFGLENNNLVNVNFYPNPATDVLNIVSDHTIKNVRIINFTGQILFDQNFSNTNLTIETSVLQSGLYIIRVETSGGVKTGKVTIN